MDDTTEQPSDAAQLAHVTASRAGWRTVAYEAEGERDQARKWATAWKRAAKRWHDLALRQDTDFDAKWEQANKGLVDRLMDLAMSRRWAWAWKQVAKRWHGIAYETHLTTADVLTRDAAIQRGDNFATEHARALLRVGVLEGLLRRANEYNIFHWSSCAGYNGDKTLGCECGLMALLADIDAALAGMGKDWK